MRGLCGGYAVQFLKLPALGREPAIKQSCGTGCILHGWHSLNLAPESNWASRFWFLQLPRDQQLCKIAEG